MKNKTFFFGSFEGWRVRKGKSTRSTVPASLEKSGDFSQTDGLSAG